MGDDEDLARPSLILAGHDNAQREHHHQHQHNHFHRRQAAPSRKAVSEVVQTVSVLKQVDVDSQGRTVSIETIVQTSSNSPPALSPQTPSVVATTTTSTAVASSSSIPSPSTEEFTSAPQEPTSVPSPSPLSAVKTPQLAPSPSTPAAPIDTPSSVETPTTDTSSQAKTTSSSVSSVSSETELSSQLPPSSTPTPTVPAFPVQAVTTAPTSTPFPTAPAGLPFSSFSVPANISTLISSSSSFTQSFSNSSRVSNTLAHATILGLTSSKTKSTSGRYSPSSSHRSAIATGAGGPGGFVGGGPLPAGATASPGSGSISDKSTAPSTPVVVASVVGSVAGASIVFLVLLLLVKWWKRNQSRISLGDGDGIDGTESGLGGTSPRGMIERRSFAQAVPAALAGLTGYKRSSKKPDQFEAPPAEQGFYRVSGRKIQSVLRTGGDGFGDEDLGEGHNTMSGSSFYRDSDGFYGGPGPSSSPHVGISIQRDADSPIMRPSPARTPVTEPGPFSSLVPPPLDLPPRRPDAIGRSRPSQDSSHPSRFTELV